MTNQFRVKNHYIPQLYLNNWSQDGKIYVYNNLVSHPKVPLYSKKSIKSIAYINHLYTDLVDKQEHDDFERWLSEEVEAPYKKAQDKILADEKLGYDDYKVLVRFMMAQFWRVPYNYVGRYSSLADKLEPVFKKAVEESLAKVENMIKTNAVFPQRPSQTTNSTEFPIKTKIINEQETSFFSYNVLLGRKAWLGTTRRMVDSISDKTRNHKWQIIKAIDGRSWLTSDNPVTLLRYHSDTKYDFNGAWKQKNTNIFMPISPQHLLFTQVGSKKRVVNTEKFQNMINRFIIENSFLQIYMDKPNEDIISKRPRTVDEEEYKRITDMLNSWHSFQTEGEISFVEEA